MFYRKAIALSVAAALALTSGCNLSVTNDEVVVPQGKTVTDGDVTIINGSDLSTPPTEDEKITIDIGFLEGSPALSAGHLLKSNEEGVSYENYNSKVYTSEDEIFSALLNGDIPIASVPIDVASRLYNQSNGGFEIAMINSLFNYCIATQGTVFNDISELKGKTIAIAEDDSMGKAVINKLAADYDLEPDIVTVKDNKEIVAGLSDKSIDIAFTQVPYLCEAEANNANVTMGIDLYDSWFEHNDSDMVTGCLVASSNYIKTHGKAFMYFMKDYDASVTITRKNIDESAQLAEKYGLASSAEVAKNAIPGCSITSVKDSKMIDLAGKCLNFLGEADIVAIGTAIPKTDFYYTEN